MSDQHNFNSRNEYEDDASGNDRKRDIPSHAEENQSPFISQTNFHAPVTGPIHTGSGDINITSPYSTKVIKDGLDEFFRWSEADEHARSSWAGMVIWSLTALPNASHPDFGSLS